MIKSIAVVGGGPGGLFFSALVKRRRPDLEVTVFERNRTGDTFGFGVVFSDRTLDNIHAADPVLRTALAEDGVHWDRIEVRLKGERISAGGNGMAAIVRRRLLELLAAHAESAGVRIVTSTQVAPGDPTLADFDVIVAADGANSAFRDHYADRLEPSAVQATAKFIWFGTDYLFDGLTFVHERSVHGNFAVHGYPISTDVSTFIVETDEATWRAAGLDEFDTMQPPGPSDEKTRDYLTRLFDDQIDGHRLLINNSRWGNFRTRRARRWHVDNVVFLGDAVHTAHFSVGSGTKMAMEDAIVLADELSGDVSDLDSAFERYEERARPAVAKIQGSAGPSLAWWEHFSDYYRALDPVPFAFHFLSRSIGVDRLERRDAEFVAAVRRDWQAGHGAAALETPLTIGDRTFAGRLVRPKEVAGTATVVAPESPAKVPDMAARVAPANVPIMITGGDRLTRTLLSERLRFVYGRVTILPVCADHAVAEAETLVLSGRSDLAVAEAVR